MPDVLLDGVKFEFPDPQPASFSEARARLEETLAANGRVLAGLWVDGQPFEESLGAQALAAAARVEAASLTLADALAQASAALAPEFAALQTEADALASAVVQQPWSEVQTRCVRLIESTAQATQRGVDIAALLGEGHPAGAAVAQLAEALERWMDGVQQADAAAVCLHLDAAIAPALTQVHAALQGTHSS